MNQEIIQNLLTKNPYFNVSGITSSEANYICERIKETLKPIQDELSFLETHTSSLDGEKLDDFKRVENIDEKLKHIGELYAISAFFRTAIKEKERRIKYINDKIREIRYYEDKYLADVDLKELEKIHKVEMDDYLLTLPLADVISYKTAEARASHIGKFIHNFDEIRHKLTKQEKISLKQVGEQVFKIHHTPLYELDELQQTQNQLLAEHRDYENTVNFYKAKFREFENQAQVRYEEELNKRQNERNAILNERVKAKTEQFTAVKAQIANFKIIVPNEFKETIDELLKKA